MTTIFVNGCFDVLHRGHLELLLYAKSLGDSLVVAIDSDTRVSMLKGPGRPVNPQDDRKFMLESLECVDEVYSFGSPRELEILVDKINPDTMIVGEEYRKKTVIGHRPHIHLEFFPRLNEYSTTKILQDTPNR